MTKIDQIISESLGKLGIEFYPVQASRTGLVGITNDPKQKGCLSVTISTSPMKQNGKVVDTHYFYMFQRRNEEIDVLNDINPKQAENVKNALLLTNMIGNKFTVTEKGEKNPFIDLLDCLECGQEFTLEIEYSPNLCL